MAKGNAESVTYNDDALQLTYFMPSRKTGFAIKRLTRFDSECLIGQISYKQPAEIYNHYNMYEKDRQDDTDNQ